MHVGGNLKFEVKPPARGEIHARLADVIHAAGIGPVIVAGSTLEGEEAMLIDAFRAVRKRYAQAMLVLAPRHPERFESVVALLASSGLPFVRRSQWAELPFIPNNEMTGAPVNLTGGVLLLDSIGELASVYEFADLAFIGGSLVPKGGHNVLEPAYFGVPILVGPHTENFRDIIDIFRRADALRVVTPQTLMPVMLDLLANVDERERLGRNAQAIMRAQRAQRTERRRPCSPCCQMRNAALST